MNVPKLNTAELIDSLDNGNFAFVLSEKMKELVRAVKETGKKGSLSLTLTLEPMPKFGDAVAVIPNLKANIPQQTYKQMIRFMTESGMPPVDIECDFKFRLTQGIMAFGVRMLGVEKMLRDALDKARQEIEEQTSLPVYL